MASQIEDWDLDDTAEEADEDSVEAAPKTIYERAAQRIEGFLAKRGYKLDREAVEDMVRSTTFRECNLRDQGFYPKIKTDKHFENHVVRVIRFDILDWMKSGRSAWRDDLAAETVIRQVGGRTIKQYIGGITDPRRDAEDDRAEPDRSLTGMVERPREKYRYMRRRFDQIRSSQEEQIVRWLQYAGWSVAEVVAELSKEKGRQISDTYVYEVWDKHTYSEDDRPDLYYPATHEIYGEIKRHPFKGWPRSSFDATREFNIFGKAPCPKELGADTDCESCHNDCDVRE